MRIFEKILLCFIVCILTCTIAQGSIRPLYSDDYANRLEVCGPFQENLLYNSYIPNKKIYLKSEEIIVGIRNGKCLTRSDIRLRQHNKLLITINCKYSAEQRKSLADKIREAKQSPAKEKQFRQLQNYYINNRPDICTTINHIED